MIGQNYSVKVVPLELNGSAFSPSYYKNEIVFCSDHKDRVFHTIVGENGLEPVDLYTFHPDTLSKVNKFSTIHRTDYNDGPITFNEKGDYSIVSRNLVTDEKYKTFEKDSNWLGLYASNYTNGKWDSLIELPFNSIHYNCTHPFLSKNADTLWFSSNMPGGFGGYDIWMSIFENNQWGKPQNLGENINSNKHEIFPSVNGNTLYLSNDKEGLGGLDIYFINRNSFNDSLQSFASPINSEFDDFGIVSIDNGNTGYLSSNRNGKDQIWSFHFNYPSFENCDTLVKDVFCFTLYEENAKEIGEVDALVYQWDINEDIIEGIEIYYCFPGPGDYEITLQITDTIINKTYYDQAYYYINLDYTIQPYIDSPDTVQKGTPFKLSAEKTNLPDVSNQKYYWDFGDDKRGRGVEQIHQFDKAGTYTLQLGVLGVSYGDSISNCVIKTIVVQDSLATPYETFENIIPNQVNDTSVVTDFGYYYSDPLDTNIVLYSVEVFQSDQQIDESDFQYRLLKEMREELLNATDEELDLFIKQLPEDSFLYKLLNGNKMKMEYLEDEDVFSILIGNWNKITDAHEVWVGLVNLGVDDAIVRSFNISEIDSLPVNKSFTMSNIQFEYEQWSIRKESEKNLLEITSVLKDYPFIKLEFSAHTDGNGDENYNLILSEKRANSVLEYFVNKGINKNRLASYGFGEKFPIADNETDEGRQINRRVEFKFVIN